MQSNWVFPGVVAALAICGFSGIGLPGNADAATPAATWPHTLTAEGIGVVVYQPQAIDWPDHETLTTREAIAITPTGNTTAMLGTIVTSFSTRTDAATGDVILSNPALVSSHFPALDTAQAARIDGQIRQALPKIEPKPVPLPSVLLSLQQQAKPNDAAPDNDSPRIFYSAKPASLVVFDGEPVLAPVGKTGLSFAVNTNWDVFTDGRDWFLLNNGSWMAAPAYAGPYNRVAKLPKAFSSMPADQNFAAARKAIPPTAGGGAAVPAIFVSTKPAEIIITDGPPQFAPVSGTGLQTVKNTHSMLFLEPASGRFFLLVSGRWFSAHGLTEPWTFATDSLPPDFALIPPDGKLAPIRQRNTRPTMESSSYQQLEQDRQARSAGAQQRFAGFGQSGGAGGGRFGGGGERFRR